MGLEPTREGYSGVLRGLQVLDFIGINTPLHPSIPRIPPQILPQKSLLFYKSWPQVLIEKIGLKTQSKKWTAPCPVDKPALSFEQFDGASRTHGCCLPVVPISLKRGKNMIPVLFTSSP